MTFISLYVSALPVIRLSVSGPRMANFCLANANVVPRSNRYVFRVTGGIFCFLIGYSEKAIQSRSCHRDIQAPHPLDAPRKPISPTLRPRPPLLFFPQIRQKPDDRPKYVHSLLDCFLSRYDTLVDLATIFCPGLLSHPSHGLSPTEHKLSQDVLEFLITHYTSKWVATPSASVYSQKPLHSLTPLISPNDASTSTSVHDDEGPDGWRVIRRHPPAAETIKGKR